MKMMNETASQDLDQNRAAVKWLPILMYHHVVPQRRDHGPENLEVTVDEFEEQMKSLRDWGFRSVHLVEAGRSPTEGQAAAARPVVITFDDGYLDIFLHAFPILKKYGFTAVLFLVSSYLDGSAVSDRREPLLGLAELQEMASYGISFGSHSITHRRLMDLSRQEAWEEIQGSKTALESLLGVPIDSFSFPYGCTTSALQGMVREAGYLLACGIDQREHTLYNLSRIDAAKCRGADFRWRMNTSGLYFHVRQRNSLRKIRDLLFRLKPGGR